jgi:hypothetical protein
VRARAVAVAELLADLDARSRSPNDVAEEAQIAARRRVAPVAWSGSQTSTADFWICVSIS